MLMSQPLFYEICSLLHFITDTFQFMFCTFKLTYFLSIRCLLAVRFSFIFFPKDRKDKKKLSNMKCCKNIGLNIAGTKSGYARINSE